MTAWTLLTIFSAVVVLVVLVRLIPALRAYLKFRGERLITCPETHKTEAVDVAARKAAVTALFGGPTLRLDRCSRWPERQDCGQECLQQVATDPEHCLVWNIVSNWYHGKSCVYCHKPFGPMQHLDHAPALLGPDHVTAEWNTLLARSAAEYRELMAWLHLRRYQPQSSFRNWVYRIAVNAAVDVLRKDRPSVDIDDAPLAAPGASPEEIIVAQERARIIRG